MDFDLEPGHDVPAAACLPSERYRAYVGRGAAGGIPVSAISLLDRLLGFDTTSAPKPDWKSFAPLRRHEGWCRTCGDHTSLSFEHFPPGSMGNSTVVRRAAAHDALESEDPSAFPRASSRQVQRGAGARVLCGKCNSYFGTHYVPALAAFGQVVSAGVRTHLIDASGIPGCLELDLDEWQLGDIARAGLVCAIAQGVHDRLLRAYPGLSEVLLAGRAGLPPGLRLGLTYVVGSRVRASPPQALAGPDGVCVFLEMAAAPFAWTLCFMGEGRVALDRTVDVGRAPGSGVTRRVVLCE